MDLKTCYEQMAGDYEAVMGRLRQEERVVKGWFPENPVRHGHYEKLRQSRRK